MSEKVDTPMPKAGGIYVADVFEATRSVVYAYGPDGGPFEPRTVTLQDPGFDVNDLDDLGRWALDHGANAKDCTIYRNTNENTAAIAWFREPDG